MECPPPLGGGSLAEFSARQLEQLQSLVRAAMREEIGAQRLHGEALLQECRASGSSSRSASSRRVANALVARALSGGHPRWKAADEPVVAEGDLGASPETTQPTSLESTGLGSGWNRSSTVHAILMEGRSAFTVDANASWWQVTQCWIKTVVHSSYFDIVMGVIIVMNCVFIGVEVQVRLDGHDMDVVSWLNSIFLIWFVVEALLRVIADGRSAFQSPWFRFDIILVFGGVLVSWVIMPIMAMSGGTEEIPYASQLLTLRILRLLRTVRVFRTMKAFSELCRLCNGLLRSLRTMLAVVLLVGLAIFSFAVLGVDLITYSESLKANDETRMIVESRFSSLPDFMLTLSQFTTADSLAGIYYPLCQVQPLLGLYFAALWMVITVALMNPPGFRHRLLHEARRTGVCGATHGSRMSSQFRISSA
ncbi:unnamed protein product [Prorocentrum cordatum]|uniref:Ion transport domain-containing protein n=1 Tax=Prorocentrum cordatum TaxID=2364126 RepID=A0ABN9UWQ1_9DINO|nr:unnamed protein product [Polarella glacialis]